MSIERYSRQEMLAIIGSILNRKVSLVPIGNHELRRHLVYKVKTDNGIFVFKYYYQDIFGGREISTLKILENSNIKHPNLVSSGTFGKDREWLMMEALEGMPLNKVMRTLTEENLYEIFESMGEELARLHELKTFESFGSLNEDLTYNEVFSNYREAFIADSNYSFNKIINSNLSDKKILLKAIQSINDNLYLLDNVSVARLTHSDYCPRNIFVSKVNNKRVLKAVLDYELCRPWDKNSDFSHMFLKHFQCNKKLETAFFKGYNKFSSLDSNYYKTKELYMLYLCVRICSWALDTAPEYYKLAMTKIKEIM